MRRSMKTLAIMWVIMAGLDTAAGGILGASWWGSETFIPPFNALFNLLCAGMLTVVLFVGTVTFLDERKKAFSNSEISTNEG
jgi:hypothetical protein